MVLWIAVILLVCAFASYLGSKRDKNKLEKKILMSQEADKQTRENASRACPECGEQILKIAKKCRYCTSEVTPIIDTSELEVTRSKDELAEELGIPQVHRETKDGFSVYKWDGKEYRSEKEAIEARDARLDRVLQKDA